MASRDELVQALIKADKAGDTEAATLFASKIKEMDVGTPRTSMVGMMADPNAVTGSAGQRAWLGAKEGAASVARGVGQTVGDIVESQYGQRPPFLPSQESVAARRAEPQPNLGTAGAVARGAVEAIPSIAMAAVAPEAELGQVAAQAGVGAMQEHAAFMEQATNALWNAGMTYGLQSLGRVGSQVLDFFKGTSKPASDVAQRFIDKGYAVLPSQLSKERHVPAPQVIAGQTGTERYLALKNQEITDAAINREMGVPSKERMTDTMLKDIRNEAGYQVDRIVGSQPDAKVFKMGTINDDVNHLYQLAENARDRLSPELDRMLTPNSRQILNINRGEASYWTPSEIRDLSQRLRADGNANMKADPAHMGDIANDKLALGEAQLRFAEKLENSLGKAFKDPTLKGKWDAARTKMAKTYDLEAALNPTSGHYDAQILARLQKAGRPLGGALKDAADFARTYGSVAQSADKVKALPNLGTFEGSMFGLAAALHRPEVALLMGVRPVSRWVSGSRGYQNWLNSEARAEAIKRGQHIGLGFAAGVSSTPQQ